MQNKVYDVPMMVIDHDNSQISRSMTQALDSNEAFKLAGYLNSPEEFTDAVRAGKAYACVYFPENFERDIKRGKQARVAVMLDVTNILIGNVTYKAAATVIGTYSSGVQVQKLMMRGTPTSAVRPSIIPINAEYRAWFNPTWNYLNFLLLGLMGTIIQQVTLLTVALGLSKEWEKKTATSLLGLTHRPIVALTGKFLAYMVLMLPVALICLSVTFYHFGAPNTGGVGLVVGVTSLFVALLCLAGVAVSGLTRDSLYSTQLLMMVAVPSFILSGYTWPAFAMPTALQYISFALPLTHFLTIMRRVTLMGAPIRYLTMPLLTLGVWLIVAAVGAYLATWKLMKQAQQ